MKHLNLQFYTLAAALFLGFFLTIPTGPATASVDPYIKGVSMVNLIATPDRFQNKIVRVFGYLRLDFEGRAIYLHEDDYEHSLYKNGLWVSFKDGAFTDEQLKALDGKYVLLEGTFDAGKQGHMGLWSGAVDEIYRAQEWGD